MTALVDVKDLRVTIASMHALRGFSIAIPRGSMIGLSGRNGAGKTTLMRTLMGHLTPVSGSMHFDGTDLGALQRHERAGLGIGYMPEDRGLVPELTVEENVLLPTWVSKTLDGKERLALVYDVIGELKEMRDRKAMLLSGGQQKLVALGRAIAVGTRLLLLDEPFEGIAPALSNRIAEVIGRIKGQDRAILISQSEVQHTRGMFDDEYMIERGANRATERHAAA